MAQEPEPWLRGPVSGVPALLQPVAHALQMADEDVTAALDGVSDADTWLSPHGLTPLGFHVAHLSGSTDRLFTYARGASLDDRQRAVLQRERVIVDERPPLAALVSEWQSTVVRCLDALRSVSEDELREARAVGRAQLPSTMLGLLFHAAEHASRHTGQVVTTTKLVRALGRR